MPKAKAPKSVKRGAPSGVRGRVVVVNKTQKQKDNKSNASPASGAVVKKQAKKGSKANKKPNNPNKASMGNKRPRDQDDQENREAVDVEAKKRRKVEEANNAAYAHLQKFVEATDVFVVVMDARDPQRCRPKKLEQLIQKDSHKRIIFVLNKIDLVPQRTVEGWIKIFSKEYPTIPFMATGPDSATGAEALVKLLSHYAIEHSKKAPITVGVVGFASVGRSSLISTLKPLIHSSSKPKKDTIKLNDTPTSLPNNYGSSGPIDLLLRSKIITTQDLLSATSSIVMRCKKQPLMLNYSLPTFDTGIEFLEELAKQQGSVMKGAVPDTASAARFFLRELCSGKMAFYTTAAASSSDSKSVVPSWSKDFRVSVKDAVEMLNGFSFPIDRIFSLALAPHELEEEKIEEEHGGQRE